MLDGKALAAEVAGKVRGFVGLALEPIRQSISDLEKRLNAIPAGQKGEPGERGPVGEPGPPGKDGLNGEKGIDATPGRDGRDGLPGIAGKDGEAGLHGKDGQDGFGLDDFDVSLGEDGRTLSFKFVRGDVVKERQIKLANMAYREVWREREYERGDVVTWNGSAWHCQRTTTEKPSFGCADWKMMVKEGRPGKDFVPAVQVPRDTVRLK